MPRQHVGILCEVLTCHTSQSVYLSKASNTLPNCLPRFLSHLQAYGKTTYLITSLQLVPRGTEGAVSLEGTMAGLGAAALYAATALALGQVGAELGCCTRVWLRL